MAGRDALHERALSLDRDDPLAAYRERFVISDESLIYFDGNSLGRLPRNVASRVNSVVEAEWGTSLIRGWNQGWWDSPARVGEKIGALLGAAEGQVVVSDQTSIDLFKLASAALRLRPGRTRIITDSLNFPSDLYILQGLDSLLGDRHQIIRVGSGDGDITPDLASLEANLDDAVALVTLSHVTFKSGYLYDMKAVTDLAHRCGALVLWDLSHSAGVVPISLDACNADFAIGCTYKYLNGGPGAPAFLYVIRRLQDEAISPIWGWWGERQPFEFGLDYRPAAGAKRFLTGTAPILSVAALDAGLAPVIDAGIGSIRAKSVALTEFAIELFDSMLAPLGFTLGSPRDSDRRGSHISVRHPEGYRITRALIEQMNVIPDYREPDNIRLGFAPLYVRFLDVWEGMDRLRRAVTERLFDAYPVQRLTVT
jgi:kynureninase